MSDHPGRVDGARVWQYRFLDAHLDQVRYPDGSVGEQVLIKHPGAAAVVPFLSDPRGDDPQVFFWFVEELADLVMRNAGWSDVLRNVRSPDALTPLRQRLMEAGAGPLARAQAAGLVRKDLRPMDIRLIATLLGAGFQGADEAERRAVSARTRALLLDGLRSR